MGRGGTFPHRCPGLISCVEGAAGAAVSGGGFPAGDMGTRGCSEWEGTLTLRLFGALKVGEKSGILPSVPSCFLALPLGVR